MTGRNGPRDSEHGLALVCIKFPSTDMFSTLSTSAIYENVRA
jgi:hypothetical protein